MTSYQWYLTKKREELLKLLSKTPDAGMQDTSQLLEFAVEEYLKRHGSGNPAYQLNNFMNKSDFLITPAFDALSNIWIMFLGKCKKIELERITAKAEWIADKARTYLRIVN